MATKPNNTAPIALVLVDGQWMLPLEDGIQLVRLLAMAVPIQRDYVSGVGYQPKFSKQTKDYTITPVTVAQLAAMSLED
jgi:hypothetical protein